METTVNELELGMADDGNKSGPKPVADHDVVDDSMELL